VPLATNLAPCSEGVGRLKTEAGAEAGMGDEITRIGPRPHAVFEAATLPHLKPLFRLAVRLTGHATAAEDLVQETYLDLVLDQALPDDVLKSPAALAG
jgi:Sigma-70 region 2